MAARHLSSVRPRLLVALCCGAMMSLAIGINLLPVFLTTLSQLFGGAAGLTQEQLGRLGGVGFAGLGAGIVLTGPFADRWGTKPFALAGNAVIAASLGLLAWAPTYGMLGLALGLLGFGAGMLDMVLSPIVAVLFPEKRTRVLNGLHAFYCVGAVVTVLIGKYALHAEIGWRGTCLLLIPLPLLLTVLFGYMRFPALTTGNNRVRLRTLIRRKWFLGALFALMLGGATELGMVQWLPAYTETVLGYSRQFGATALIWFSVAMAVGRIAVGTWGRQADPFHLVAVSGTVGAGLIVASALLQPPAAALVACIGVGVAVSCLWPTLLAIAADRYPEGGASMYGALASCGNAGGIFMPWMIGWVADVSGLRWGIALVAIAPLVLVPVVLILRATRARA